MAELSEVALELADSGPALVTAERGSARVVARISPVMQAEPIWLANGLSITPGARQAAGRGGAQPGRHQRPLRRYRRYLRRKLVPVRLGPLPAGSSA